MNHFELLGIDRSTFSRLSESEKTVLVKRQFTAYVRSIHPDATGETYSPKQGELMAAGIEARNTLIDPIARIAYEARLVIQARNTEPAPEPAPYQSPQTPRDPSSTFTGYVYFFYFPFIAGFEDIERAQRAHDLTANEVEIILRYIRSGSLIDEQSARIFEGTIFSGYALQIRDALLDQREFGSKSIDAFIDSTLSFSETDVEFLEKLLSRHRLTERQQLRALSKASISLVDNGAMAVLIRSGQLTEQALQQIINGLSLNFASNSNLVTEIATRYNLSDNQQKALVRKCSQSLEAKALKALVITGRLGPKAIDEVISSLGISLGRSDTELAQALIDNYQLSAWQQKTIIRKISSGLDSAAKLIPIVKSRKLTSDAIDEVISSLGISLGRSDTELIQALVDNYQLSAWQQKTIIRKISSGLDSAAKLIPLVNTGKLASEAIDEVISSLTTSLGTSSNELVQALVDNYQLRSTQVEAIKRKMEFGLNADKIRTILEDANNGAHKRRSRFADRPDSGRRSPGK